MKCPADRGLNLLQLRFDVDDVPDRVERNAKLSNISHILKHNVIITDLGDGVVSGVAVRDADLVGLPFVPECDWLADFE